MIGGKESGVWGPIAKAKKASPTPCKTMDKLAGMRNGWHPVWRFRMFRPLTTYPFYHLLNPFVHSTEF